MAIKIRLTNSTHYNTMDLRVMIRAGLEAHGLTACRVDVKPRRRRGCGGRAQIGDRGFLAGAAWWMGLYLDAPGGLVSSAEQVAKIIDHEIYHLRGLHHRNFPGHVERCIGEPGKRCPWFNPETMQLRYDEPGPEPVVSLEERRSAKLAHAEAMHRKSLTRLKRAQTLEKKWRTRLKTVARAADRAKASSSQ